MTAAAFTSQLCPALNQRSAPQHRDCNPTCLVSTCRVRRGCSARESLGKSRHCVNSFKRCTSHRSRISTVITANAKSRNDVTSTTPINELVGQAVDPYTRVAHGSPAGPISDAFWGGLGTFVSFCILGVIDVWIAPTGLPFMIGSFGTISILLFGAPTSIVLNKWNIVVGHLLAAIIILLFMKFFVGPVWLMRALAMGAIVTGMMITGSVHPPGGALILACCDSAKIQALGWWYLLYPGLAGVVVLLVLAHITDLLKAKFVFGAETSKEDPPGELNLKAA
mmetsp:Transcript_41585/g.50445  ORF Transcript_41585/g.50445 Transcript_41585/m.50445 type:complete len:280 (-) Transcript_41585:1072-1911(-)